MHAVVPTAAPRRQRRVGVRRTRLATKRTRDSDTTHTSLTVPTPGPVRLHCYRSWASQTPALGRPAPTPPPPTAPTLTPQLQN
jgi:hypothetical protein